MNDLFGYGIHHPEKSGRSPEKSGNPPDFFRGDYSRTPELRNRTSQAKKPGEVRSPVDSSGSTTAPQSPGTKFSLLEQRSHLENEIEIALIEMEAANAKQKPFATAFYAAENALISLHEIRKSGRVVSKAEMLSAYDRRLEAGYVWNPSKQHFKRIERWVRDLRKELKWVNQEIGI